MALLPVLPEVEPDPTLDALRAEVERRARLEESRTYLGMSSIGKSCDRALWYSFRWAEEAGDGFDCDTLWNFEDGHRTEDVMGNRLRLVAGVQLRTVDPRNGEQFGFVDLGGHFRGHADGLVTGLLQAPKALHVWEAKAVNDTKFNRVAVLKAVAGEKETLKLWDPIYHGQAIMYMAYADAPRHYLTISTPGGRLMDSVRTDSDLDEARRLRTKAERVITSPAPLERVSKDPEWYECKWCEAFSICHGSALPSINCRTCVHATAELDGDGRWSCALVKKDLTIERQRVGCASHLYIPATVTTADQVDASEAENWIEYKDKESGTVFRNGKAGPGSFTSEEMRTAREQIINPEATALRDQLGGTFVEPGSMPDPQPTRSK